MGEMRSVDLPGDVELAYTGRWVPSLRGQPFFKELDLTEVTDEILHEVGEMPWLTVLKCRGEFTDTGVEALRDLSGLIDLTLESPLLRGEFALPEADLRVVSLAGDRLGDRSFRMLGLHPELKVVRLTAGEAVGTGLGWLPPGLRMLYLRLPRLAPDALDVLSRMPYLSTLTFADTVPTLRLVSHLVRHAGQLTRVEFRGVEQPAPDLLRALAEAGIRVNADLQP
ncbi:hypothetical protein [Actinocorallia populi]|uniref:hypothetical protein n=1 Tax=Actinocorallia populi TaxID=2079200 RepID=UPI000D097E40|nr:hypothetical protein [Actinocorallia populi]